PVFLQVLQHELVLVDQLRVEDDVFRPDVLLIVGKKILQLEMFGELGVLILRGDLDEAAWRRVIDSLLTRPCRRPVSNVVKTELATFFFRRRPKRDDAEVSKRLDRVADFQSEIPDSRPLRRDEG